MKKQILAFFLTISSVAFAEADTVGIWKAKCQSCHGPDGKAQTKVGKKEEIADMSTKDWQKKRTDADLRKVIEDGSEKKPKMKAFKEKLSAEEIDALVGYIRDLSAKS
jgi:mono/diheme cytochrome c family protein